MGKFGFCLYRLVLAWVVMSAALMPALAPAGPAEAAGQTPTFTLTGASAFLRSAPAPDAARVYSVFKGQVFTIIGRTQDQAWVRLDFAGAAGEAWIPTNRGTVAGDLRQVPVTNAGAPPAAAAPAPAANAAPIVAVPAVTHRRFVITADSLFGRAAPAQGATRLVSLFKGQAQAVIGRSADYNWVQIAYGDMPVWVPASAGQVSGGLYTLPVVSGAAPEAPTAAPPAAPGPVPAGANAGAKPNIAPPAAALPVISAHMREIYQQSAARGRNPSAFSAVGDCNTAPALHLFRLTTRPIDPALYGHLQPTINRFYSSFSRDSIAVSPGFTTGSMFDTAWANYNYCARGEAPFPCELRTSNASIVFIGLGTNDLYQWKTFEENYRQIIEYALQQGVLPVLVTKADDTELNTAGLNYLNNIVRGLAAQSDVPLLDFWLATRQLPNNGMDDSYYHLTEEGHDLRLLALLETLQAITAP